MKHAIFTFLLSSICLTTDAQSSFMETMNGFFARQDYDGGLSFLKRQNTLEQGAKDIYYVLLSLSKQDLDEEAKDSCIHSIERIVAEVSIHSDEIPPAGRKEWITYFTAFSNFLSHTAAWPLAMKVHKAFRDICPKIDSENKLFYTYELEYTMLSLCGAYNYHDLIPILDEIIALQDSGYHFSKPPYYYYHLLGLCYENTKEDNKAMECLAIASANYPQGEKDSDEYVSLQKSRFDAAVRTSSLTSAREAGYELIRIFRSNGDDLRLTGTCISLAKLEYTLAANVDDAFKLYEEGIGLILKNSYYTKEDRDNYLKDLFKLYNTYNIPKENRKFARFATDLDDGKKYNVNRYVDEAFIDSLTNVIKSEEGKKELDVKRYTYAVAAVATYMANRAHEKEGLDLALRAIERCKEQDRSNDFISLYNTIGDIYKINLNDYGKAQEYYTESLKQLQAKGLQEGELYISTLNSMAANFMSQGNLVNAKIYIDKTLKLTRNSTVAIAQKANYYDALKNACTIYTSLRQEGKALQFCDELLENISMSHNDKELDNAKFAKISCLLNFDRYDEAHELLKQISPEYLDKVGVLPFSVKFFANDASCVDELAKMHDKLYADAKRLFSDFSMSDLAEYWDTYAGSLNDHCSAALYKFRTKEASLQTFNNLQTTRNFMFQLAKNIRKTGGTDPSAYHSNSPQATDNTFSSIGDFNQIKNKLNDNEAAIEFLLVKDWKDFRHTENRYGALIVRNNDEAPVFVDLCPQYAIDDIAALYPSADPVDYAQNLYSIQNTQLHDILWAPLEPYLAGKTTIFVSKMLGLGNINISAISDGKQRVGEAYDIHNVMSASSILEKPANEMYSSAFLCGGIDYDTSLKEMAMQQKVVSASVCNSYAYRSIKDRGALSFLTSSIAEITGIKDIIKNEIRNVEIATGKDASEEKIKSLSGKAPDIIHLATHGFYYQPDVVSSQLISGKPSSADVFFSDGSSRTKGRSQLRYNGLFFSGANNAWNLNKYEEGTDDGVLTGDEISALDFSGAKLVVLSACQTGLGNASDIDGNIGLIKAFKIAGAKHIVSTLWNVNDQATAFFMQEFYQQLTKERNAYRAFLKTVEKFRSSNEAYANPYYWAGFVFVD